MSPTEGKGRTGALGTGSGSGSGSGGALSLLDRSSDPSLSVSSRRNSSSNNINNNYCFSGLPIATTSANTADTLSTRQHTPTFTTVTTNTNSATTNASNIPNSPRRGGLPNQPKLRRKAPFETIQELTHVQRLVDYFVVVTCQPRRLGGGTSTSEALDSSNRRNNKKKTTKRRLLRLRNNVNKASNTTAAITTRRVRTKESRQEQGVETDNSNSCGSSSNEGPGNSSSNNNTNTNTNNSSYSGNDSIDTMENIRFTDQGGDHTFRPIMSTRYPLTDHTDNPLNPMILQFCLPAGDVIVPSKSYEMPRVHHFVLTNERGRKIYGTCLTVFEEFVPPRDSPWCKHSLTEEDISSLDEVELRVVNDTNRKKALYLPKVLCLLSTWPYLTAFREYLSQLYRLATMTNTMPAPIERYVVNLYEIPAPPPGAYEVQVNILNSTIRFWAPPAKLPIAYTALPFWILFECLDIDNILKLWGALLMERKVLLLSSQYSILTVCAEILCSLLFPLRWSHLYIPLLPKMLCPMLDAPVPYLCGIVRENWLRGQMFVSGDTIVVDLDRNSVVFGDLVPPTPALPTKKLQKLQSCLVETVGHVFWRARGLEKDYWSEMSKKSSKRHVEGLKQNSREWTEKLAGLDHAFNLAYTPDSPNVLSDTLPDDERNQWDRVQSGFLRFFTALLKDYRKFLQKTGPNKWSFDRVGFLASQKAERADFLLELSMTQQFDDFLTRRMYSPGEPDLVFFDQSIDAKLNRSKLKLNKKPTPFLQSAKVHKELKKIQAVEVNEEGLTEIKYVYDKWPDEFDSSLFSEPRPVPKMIAAEFDRQSALVAKLRANVVDESDEILDFYGGDYDDSPEVASFTVFFFVYSDLVGRDWQEYQRRRAEEVKTFARTALVEKRDEPEEVEAVLGQPVALSPNERVAVNGCVSDLSMGVCDTCPEESILALKSAMVYCGDGAHDMYTKLFEKTAEQVAELQLQLNVAAMKQKEAVIDAEDAWIEYEEAKEVASAQLDLAFETLQTMSLRGLSTDSDAYLSLMEACGRCGDTQRALHLIQLMRNDGFAADGEVLGCFVSAFAHQDLDDEGSIEVNADSQFDASCGSNKSDAYSKYLKKKLAAAKGEGIEGNSPSFFSALLSWKSNTVCGPEDDNADESSSVSTTSWTEKSPTGGVAFLDWITTHQETVCSSNRRKHRRRRRRQSSVTESRGHLPVTDFSARQLELSEALLDFLYPDLEFDMTDCCPHCSHELSEGDVVAGWTPCAFQDYTAACPKCSHRFVPRFSVSSSSSHFEGSQGPQTPLYCEFLSPWVIRKELQHIVKGEVGIKGMLKPSWRQGTGIEATLFWNMLLMCRRYRLPFSFLLQGSFERSRLTLPRMPADM